jgi:RimJ/RimL family protein N-acetyltransferase
MNSLLFRLTLKTSRLVLRVPTEEEIEGLAQVAANGIQKPGESHFHDDRLYGSFEDIKKFLLEEIQKRATECDKEDWQLPFAIFYEGKPVGMVTMYSKQFYIAKGFGVSYWIGLPFQRKRIGTETVRTVLSLGFDGLGAREAYGGAWSDNIPSLRVMEKLGFIFNGEYWMVRQGKAVKDKRMRLPKEHWIKPNDILIEGLESCLHILGASV